MKKILTLAFLFLSVFAFSQRQTTRYLTLGCNIQQTGSSSGKPHISCNCSDQGGTFDSGDVLVGDTLIFNDGGIGYKLPIDSIVTPGVPTIVVRVDWTGLGLVLVPTGRGAISRGATNGLDGTIAGLTPGDNQYLEEDFVNNIDHVAGNYTFVTTDSFTTFTPSSPAPAVGDFILDGRRGSTWRKSGASAYTRVTLDNGNNVSSVYNVTNDTLSFNSNLYNHVRLSTGDSSTAYVLAPDHIASQFVGELFVIGFGSGSNVVTVTWDTLYGTFALGNMPSVMIPANSIVNYTFRVVSEGGEGIRLQWIDGGQGGSGIDSSLVRNDSAFVVAGGEEFFTGLAGVSPSDIAQEGAVINQFIGWNGSEYEPMNINATQFLTQNINVTVGVGGDYSTLNSALDFASKYISAFDSIVGSYRIRIQILPNTVLSERVYISSGNWGSVKITSNNSGTISPVRFLPPSPGSLNSILYFANCTPPQIDSFHLINSTTSNNSEYGIRFFSCANLNVSRVTVDSVRFGVVASASTGALGRIRARKGNTIPTTVGKTGILINGASALQIYDSSVDSYDWGIQIQDASTVDLIRDTVRLYHISSGYGLVNRGAHISIYQGDYRRDGVSETSRDISHQTGVSTSVPGVTFIRGAGVLGGTDIPVNTLTADGIIFKNNQPYNFATAASAPTARVNGYYYNTTDGLPYWSDGTSWYQFGTQAGIQYKDEGSNLGVTNTVTSVNFVGDGVTASRSSNEVTVSIPGGDGIYTPTVVLETDTLLNTYTFKYTITDSVVNISGKIRVGAASGTLIIAGTITLPPGITSNFTSVEDDVSGAVIVNQSDAITLGLSRLSARAYADTVSDLIGFSYEPIGTGGINRRNFVDFNLTITRK